MVKNIWKVKNKMEKQKENNIAFIDGQNLYFGTAENNWKIDHKKFRVYLKDKYHITEAYNFGYIREEEQDLYSNLQKAGFIIIFKKHNSNSIGIINPFIRKPSNLVYYKKNMVSTRFQKGTIALPSFSGGR